MIQLFEFMATEFQRSGAVLPRLVLEMTNFLPFLRFAWPFSIRSCTANIKSLGPSLSSYGHGYCCCDRARYGQFF